MVWDSERILKESGKSRLNFNPSFNDGVISEHCGTELLIPQGLLILGGGPTSDSPRNTSIQDFSPLFSKENTFGNQEPRATAAATTTAIHQTAAQQVGKKTSLKRSAGPNDDFSKTVMFI